MLYCSGCEARASLLPANEAFRVHKTPLEIGIPKDIRPSYWLMPIAPASIEQASLHCNNFEESRSPNITTNHSTYFCRGLRSLADCPSSTSLIVESIVSKLAARVHATICYS
jgi:hypothetical protein